MKIEGYEEISHEEYRKLPSDETASFLEDSSVKTYYFKIAQEFPIVFEDRCRKIEVTNDEIIIKNVDTQEVVNFGYVGSFPLLLKAVKKAEEVAKKNEN